MSGVTPLKRALTDLSKLPKVLGVFVVSKEGFIIDSITTTGTFDEEALAAMVIASLGSIESMGKELDLGKVEMTTVEFAGSIALMAELEDSVVVLLAEKGAILGRIRYELRKQLPRIRAAL